MYKTRLMLISMSVIVFALTFMNIGGVPKLQTQVYFDNTSAEVRSFLTGTNGNIKTKLGTLDEAGIIVSTDTDKSIQEYEKITLGYSPVVMTFPKEAFKDGSAHFSTDKNSSGQTVYTKSMKKMLLALEKSDKEDGISAASLGVSGDGNYKVIIPGVESQHRKVVIDTFISELLDGKEPTKENVDKISKSLETILNKCHTTLDIQGIIEDIDKSSYIIIFPEHALDKSKSVSPTLVYSENVVCEQLVAYYNTKAISKEYIDSWIENTRKEFILGSSFSSSTGYRVFGGEWNTYSPFGVSIDIVNNKPVSEELESLLGERYWEK